MHLDALYWVKTISLLWRQKLRSDYGKKTQGRCGKGLLDPKTLDKENNEKSRWLVICDMLYSKLIQPMEEQTLKHLYNDKKTILKNCLYNELHLWHQMDILHLES